MRTILTSIALIIAYMTSAQDAAVLINKYDCVVYYPDSTVKSLYHVRKGMLHGEAIEFNESGKPTELGGFKRGHRSGVWISSEGHSAKYVRGKREWGTYPGCGTGKRKAHDHFQQRYWKLSSKP